MQPVALGTARLCTCVLTASCGCCLRLHLQEDWSLPRLGIPVHGCHGRLCSAPNCFLHHLEQDLSCWCRQRRSYWSGWSHYHLDLHCQGERKSCQGWGSKKDVIGGFWGLAKDFSKQATGMQAGQGSHSKWMDGLQDHSQWDRILPPCVVDRVSVWHLFVCFLVPFDF